MHEWSKGWTDTLRPVTKITKGITGRKGARDYHILIFDFIYYLLS